MIVITVAVRVSIFTLMKANVIPLQPGSYYHIYNRGINGTDIFLEDKHYQVFLDKFQYHLDQIVDVFAYCLLGNHFHYLVQVKPEEVIRTFAKERYKKQELRDISRFVSSQFAHLFNGYTQAFNKDINRTGGLFESPYRRIEVKNESYFSALISYIHRNPELHGFVDDFQDYPHSSYCSHLNSTKTNLRRETVVEWFGGKTQYQKFHQEQKADNGLLDLVIEFD